MKDYEKKETWVADTIEIPGKTVIKLNGVSVNLHLPVIIRQGDDGMLVEFQHETGKVQ